MASVKDGEDEAFVAWFEPEHHVVERAAPFFKKRFATMRWSILTPKGSVHWDRKTLRFTEPQSPRDAPPDDALDEWWRVYYRSIFNPARLKVGAMQAEMPKKYWRNMPEARLIPELIRMAGVRTEAMIERAPSVPPTRHVRRQNRVEACVDPHRLPASSLEELRARAEGCLACPLRRNGVSLRGHDIGSSGDVDTELILLALFFAHARRCSMPTSSLGGVWSCLSE